MAKPEHVAKLKEGVKVWNEWRRNSSGDVDLAEANFARADLSEAILFGADLSRATLVRTLLAGVSLEQANLNQASFIGADLFEAKIIGASLIGAHLNQADFSLANLSQAKLQDSNLTGANLIGANLFQADLSRATLTGVTLNGTIIGSTNLTNAVGLDTCVHLGASVLDQSTVARSGMLPSIFLQGCGWPGSLIDYFPSLLKQAIEFYSCFISYSSQDQVFAERLNADLRAKNLRCWFAPEDLKIGDRFHERIEESIRLFDKVMIVLSEN